MNEKERQEQLKEIISLSLIPLIKDSRRKLSTLLFVQMLTSTTLIALISVLLVLTLVKGI